jgi:hypothetical protein
MRAFDPGGRFSIDWELNEIGDGITWDSTNPYGTSGEWWVYDSAASTYDPVYDVETIDGGRVWIGPQILKIVNADLLMGNAQMSERGFYSADTLDLTINIDDLYRISPELFESRGKFKAKLQEANRYRCIWRGQVYRPYHTQPDGYVDDRGTLITLKMMQLMPDELVNDEQFQEYAQF